MYLPDFEFIMNLGDWPLIDKKKIYPPIPVFSWCKTNDTFDIVLPTYELTEASLEGMGRFVKLKVNGLRLTFVMI